jgi:hypothetical protein
MNKAETRRVTRTYKPKPATLEAFKKSLLCQAFSGKL